MKKFHFFKGVSIINFFLFFSLLSSASYTVPVTLKYTPQINDFSSIFLGSNLNDWKGDDPNYQLFDTDGDGTYEITVDVEVPEISSFQYKFVIDGWIWEADPLNSLSTGSPNYNSIMEVFNPMLTYISPMREEDYGANSMLEFYVAYSSETPLLDNYWMVRINGQTVEAPWEFYDDVKQKFSMDMYDYIVLGINKIEVRFGGPLAGYYHDFFFNSSVERVTEFQAKINSEHSDRTISLSVIAESPRNQSIFYEWTQSGNNPDVLNFSSTQAGEIQIEVPETDGEYYISLLVYEENGDSIQMNRIINAKEDTVVFNTLDHYANWINTMNLYEINPYSWNEGAGVFANVESKFDEILALGINTIWFTPIFKGGGMGYWTQDYYEIEPSLGTKEEFSDFIEAAHEKGIRIILDLVINHTDTEHPFFQSCLEEKSASPYADYYIWEGEPGESDYDYEYDWDFIPNLNVANPEVEKYLIDVAEYWVREFNIDGYRADVAWGVEQRSATLWEKLNERLKNLRPDFFLLAEAPAKVETGSYVEVPTDAEGNTILFDYRFTSAYDWDLRDFNETAGLPGLLNGTNNIENVHQIVNAEYPENALPLRFIENHDVERAMQLFGADKSKLAHAMIFTLPGIPLLYAGAETGQLDQYGGLTNDENNLKPYFRKLVNARNKYIKNDAQLIRLSNSDEEAVYSYATVSDNGFVVVSVLNFNENEAAITLDASQLNVDGESSYLLVDLLNNLEEIGVDTISTIPLSLNAYEAKVFLFKDDDRQIKNGDFSNEFAYWTYRVNADVTNNYLVTGEKLWVSVHQGAIYSSDIQLLQNNIMLETGKKYRLSFDVNNTSANSINVAIGKDQDTFIELYSEEITLLEGLNTYELIVEMNNTTDYNMSVMFELGLLAGEMVIDNIDLREYVESPPGSIALINPKGFEQFFSTQTLSVEWLSSNVELVDLWLSVDDGLSWTLLNEEISAYSGSFNCIIPEVDGELCKIKIIDSGNNEVFVISKAFAISSENENNILNNAYFNLGLNEWSTYFFSPANANVAVSEGQLNFEIVQQGNSDWELQLLQLGLYIEQGKTYEVVFDALSSIGNQTLEISVGENGGSFTNYGSDTFVIGTDFDNYSYTFTMNNETDTDARLVINLGSCEGNFIFDNFSIHEYVEPLFLNLSQQSIIFEDESETKEITVTSNTNWAVTKNADWISLDKTTGSSNETIFVSVSENDLTEERDGVITFTSEGLNDVLLSVSQQGKNLSLSVSENTIEIEAEEGSSKMFSVVSNTNWTISINESWLTANKYSGSGTEDVTLTAGENNTNAIRNAILTVEGTGVSAESIAVSQTSKTGVFSIESKVEVYPNPVSNFIIVSANFVVEKVEVITASGQLLKTQISNSNKVEIEVEDLIKGAYIIRISGGEHQLIRNVVVK